MDRSGVPKKKKRSSQSLIDHKGLNGYHMEANEHEDKSATPAQKKPSSGSLHVNKFGVYSPSLLAGHFRPEQKEHKEITEAVFLTL